MKLYCLSSHPNKPCHVLKWREITIMLDCGLSAQSVLNFLPLPLVHSPRLSSLPSWMPRDCVDSQLDGELKDCCGRILVDSPPEFSPPQTKILDFSEIDVILISNYLCMLALPFITEGTGFSGVVYCTEPTMQIGRLFLLELVEWIEQSPKVNVAKYWKEVLHLLPAPLCEAFKPRNWRHLYDMKQVSSALSKIQIVGYDEKLDIYGALKAIPISSGYCLGSANWIIQSDYEKIAYVSGSTTLTTHPKPMYQNALKNVNVLIITALTQTPTSNPDSMLGELCINTAITVRNGGCVLLPCYPSGVVYDLFECLSSHLDATGLSHIPMFFISPVADTSLAYSNILGEWLSQAKQNKVYLPEEPFPHALLVKNSRLRHFKNIYAENFSAEFRQPCIVFCGHPSLRFGDSVHFMELWGSNSLHTVIFTEPDFPYMDAISPFQPLQMKVVHCPIDTSLNFTQATKLIRELKPGTLVIPESYTRGPQISSSQRVDLLIDVQERPTLTMKRGEVLKLPVKRRKVKAEISPALASALVPCETRPGVSLTTVIGKLQLSDNKYRIEAIERPKSDNEPSGGKKRIMPEDILPNRKPSYEWGWLDIEQFVQKLSQEGITDAKVEHGNPGYIIHLQESDTLITVEDSQTHIICEGDRQLRLKLRDALLQCLNKF
ncbi:UNVERIFIED_CONTAM: hypothetical protein PYX00_010000 [Menopon gallinae]|uniref:Beta-Casp domain-containing protein n=1 Tax=Menopon gallinae TaxID=328185 RepID=A0AAW2HDM2_9NEOP